MALSFEEFERLAKVWNNGQQIKEHEMQKQNQPAPTYTKVPTLGEISRKKRETANEQIMKGTDPASMSIKNSEQKKQIKDYHNIAKQTGTTNVQNYAKRYKLDKSYAPKPIDMDALDAEAKEIQAKGTSASMQELDRLQEIYDTVDKYNKEQANKANKAKNESRKQKASTVKSDVLDDNTLAQMDARAKELQALEARTPKENDELQSIYDKKERHDKAVEKENRLNGGNHVVNNTRYNQLMSNPRLASDIDKLVDVLYNNANQDATVSEEWANTIGAKNITGGLTKEQFIDQLSKRYELTKEELNDIALSRKTEQDNAENAQYNKDLNRLGAKHPLLGSAGSFVGTVGGLGEGAYNMLANAITGDDRYTSRMFNTTKEGLREGAKQNIDSNAGKTIYDIGMGVGDMGVGALMGSAPAVLAGNTANRTLLNSIENGADPRRAALYAGLTGVTDYVTNRIGLDKAKELAVQSITSEGVKSALAKNAIAGLGEAGENVIQDVAQSIIDRMVNGNDAELSQAYNELIAQGYSEEDAFKEVAKQFGKQELLSAAQGYAMGSVMNAGQSIANSIINTPKPEKPSLGNLYDVERVFTDEDINNRIRPENVNIDGRDYVLDKGNNTLTDTDGKVIPLIDTSVFDTSKRGTKEQSKREFAEELTNFIKDNYIGKSFKVAQNGQEIQFLDRSAKEFAGSYSSMRKPNDQMGLKANLAPRFRSIIENAILNHNEPNKKAYSPIKARGMDKYDITVAYPTKNGIEIYDAVMDVGLHENGNDYFYDILNIEPKKKATPPPSPNGVGTNLEQPNSTISVPQDEGVVNTPEIGTNNDAVPVDTQFFGGESEDMELPWITPSDSTPNESSPNNRLDMNLQYFAERKSKIESELSRPDLPEDTRAELTAELDRINELISGMDERYYGKESTPQEKLSKSITNSDSRIDSEYANELKENGIGKYFSETHEQSYTDARDEVSADREGNLNRYLNNEGAMYNAKDYNKIRILEEDLKAKRKIANEEGNTELAQQITDQLHRLSEVRILRGKSGGAFNEAAKMWINTAEGAIDTAKSVVYDAIDKMPKNEANFIREMTDEVMDYANEVASSEELWNELKQGEKRLKFEQDIQKKLKALAKEKNIKVNDELAKQIAKDIIDGANSDAISREIAAFHEYEFLGIDDEVLTEVEDMLDRADEMNFNSKERVKLENDAYRKLAREIYKNGGDFKDRWDAWRYFAMLSKVATDVRNVTSTGIFSGVMNRASNGIAGMVEGGVDNGIKIAKGMSNAVFKTDYDTSKGIKRTKSFFYNPLTESSKKMLSSAYKDANENSFRGLSGHKYNYHVGEGIENNKPVFRPNSIADKTLGKAFDARSNILGAEDFFFKHNKYATSLVGWLKANGLDESIFEDSKRFNELNNKKLLTKEESAELKKLRPREELLNEGREYAIKESKYSTYNSPNKAGKLATAARELRRSDNGGARMLGRWIEGMMAFKQVPVNILKTIYDYSPLSVFTTGKKTIQALASKDDTRVGKIGIGKAKINVGQSTVADAISQASKTLTGTGMAALGAFLFDNGMLVPAEDENTGKSDETKGFQKYSLIINGKSYKIDWLGTPAAPLIMGAEAKKIYDKYHDNDTPFWDKENGIFSMGVNDVVDSAMSVFDPVTEMSFLQGFSNTLDNVRYSDTKAEAAANLIASPIASYYAQAIPTPFGALGRTIDNTRRSLRTNTDGIGGIVERNVRQNLYNKLPFLESKNMPYVDMWGREQKNLDNDNILARAGYQFISPAYVKDINVEPYQAELDRLYNLDPEHYADVLNSSFPNKVDGERLSNEDYYKAQTKAGVSKQNFINETIKNDAYKALTPDEQYEVQKSLLKLANEIGAKEVRPQKKVNDDLYTAFNGKNYGQVVNLAAEKAHDTVRNSTIKEAGLPVNEVTKSLFDNNDKEGQQKYRDGLGVAANYGYDTLTTDEWKTYNKQGGVALSRLLDNKKAAEEYGVTNTQDFREAKANGTAKSYANAYNAITNTKTGTDDLGDDTYLSYNDTTRKIYDDKGQVGLNQYVQFQNSLPKKDSLKDRDYLNTLQKSAVMNLEDKAYYFVLHKGKNVAKSAPSGNVNQYAWYLAKDYYSGSDGNLSKNEKAELYRGVHDYLKRMGFSETVAKSAQKWTYK